MIAKLQSTSGHTLIENLYCCSVVLFHLNIQLHVLHPLSTANEGFLLNLLILPSPLNPITLLHCQFFMKRATHRQKEELDVKGSINFFWLNKF